LRGPFWDWARVLAAGKSPWHEKDDEIAEIGAGTEEKLVPQRFKRPYDARIR